VPALASYLHQYSSCTVPLPVVVFRTTAIDPHWFPADGPDLGANLARSVGQMHNTPALKAGTTKLVWAFSKGELFRRLCRLTIADQVNGLVRGVLVTFAVKSNRRKQPSHARDSPQPLYTSLTPVLRLIQGNKATRQRGYRPANHPLLCQASANAFWWFHSARPSRVIPCSLHSSN